MLSVHTEPDVCRLVCAEASFALSLQACLWDSTATPTPRHLPEMVPANDFCWGPVLLTFALL